jgi:peptidoglycan/xylan/chitin deacetylase (PgdA/CDA1 family)
VRSLGPPVSAPDPREVRANEVGLIPVMMYHRVTPAPAGEYDTSCEDFRAGVRRMFAAGYRPVRTIDLVRGQLPVAAGFSPVVLTFDDGYPDQFQLTADGQVASDCAVGILQRVCREFPHCPAAGTFNINRNPFGLHDPADQVTALTRLHRLGFEIANHTYGHDNLARLTAAGVQQDFVELQRMVTHAVPGVAVRTMALPYGVMPADPALVRRGRWDGESYVNEGILLVGAAPSPSPFAASFDPTRIPRIRSTSWRAGRMPLTAAIGWTTSTRTPSGATSPPATRDT